MKIDYDPIKREETLALRGLDMAEAGLVLAGATLTVADVRKDYGEDRFLTLGFLRGGMVVLAWTQRGEICRIISIRKANDREIARYSPKFGVADG